MDQTTLDPDLSHDAIDQDLFSNKSNSGIRYDSNNNYTSNVNDVNDDDNDNNNDNNNNDGGVDGTTVEAHVDLAKTACVY